MPVSVTGKRPGIFYGWFAVIGGMFVILFSGGTFINSFGALLPVITAEFEWSRAAVSGALSAGILAFGLPSPIIGILVNRIGPRKTIIFGNMLAALGIGGVYLVQEVWQFYICYILAGIGGGFGGYIPCSTVISNWFIKRRSLAFGIFIAATGLGGFIFPPLATSLIKAIGWREAWLSLAGMVFLFSTLIGGVVLVRNRPEDLGQAPDGMPTDAYTEIEMGESRAATIEKTYGWSIRRVLKSPTIWLVGGFAATNNFSLGMVMTHQIAYLEDIKYDAMTAAATISFMSLFTIAGSILFGSLAMKFKLRYLGVAFFAAQAVGLVILLTFRELEMIYLYSALQGLSNGALTAALPTFIGAYYPRHQYSRILGVALPFQVFSTAIATIVAGSIYDATLTYTPAFITAAVFALMGLVFVFLAREPAQP